MKKMLAMGLACMIVLTPAVSVHAAELPPAICHAGGCNLGDCDGICGDHYFIDENGDGICDLHCYTDANYDGLCDYYTDANGDGICDHCHDHGRPVQSVYYNNAGYGTGTYYGGYGHHGGCHGSRSGHHRGHC